MKPLLNYTDPLYLRRLVREVNGQPDGVYWQGTRCNRARLRKVPLPALAFSVSDSAFAATLNEAVTFELRNCNGNWFVPTTIDIIVDAYGRNVCASRVQGGAR